MTSRQPKPSGITAGIPRGENQKMMNAVVQTRVELQFPMLWDAPAAFHKQNGIPPAQRLEECYVDHGESADLLFVAGELTTHADSLESSEHMLTDARVLRAQLMVEELGETIKAMANGDIVELADGLADLLYTVGGTIEAFGLGPAMQGIFAEVHRANMSKTNSEGSNRVRDKGEDWVPPNIAGILRLKGLMPKEEGV